MKIKVWDAPTRVFHWLLAASYLGLFFTAQNERLLEYHAAAGYVALGLTVFRIFWGFTGNQYARFSQFIKGWQAVKSDISHMTRLSPQRLLGHNPAVGWIALFMLAMTLAGTITGIIIYSGEESRGLWAGLFTYNAAVYARAVHEVIAYAAIAVIVLHICAALVHDFIMRENIILTMITGTEEDNESWQNRVSHMPPFQAREGRPLLRLFVLISVTISGGLALLYLPPEGKSDMSSIKQVKALDERGFARQVKPNAAWKEECAASCHEAFHPTLLPAASWDRIMANLSDHFGEDADLPPAVKREISAFLAASSAERSTTEASKKILYSIEAGSIPMRVTETPYWVDKHSGLTEDIYKRPSIASRSNCKACHPGAEAGSFEDRDIGIPEK